MLGAIVGDVVGSVWENRHFRAEPGFPLFIRGSRFTDDTILTLAIAAALMNASTTFEAEIRQAYHRAPVAGFGARFKQWIQGTLKEPYVSWGNGSAMRVSSVGWMFESLEETLVVARKSALPTHSHPKGIQGAEVTAGMIFLARQGASKEDLKTFALEQGYPLQIDNAGFQNQSVFLTSEFTVQAAILSFLTSDSFEDCIRKAVLDNGDTDTQAAIAGSIAEAFYGGVPPEMESQALPLLRPWMIEIIEKFKSELRRQSSGSS